MYCASCGMEERFNNKFCRACGSNLSIIRATLESPDKITDSAIAARHEIGSAFAQKIRETRDAVGMKIVAEEVLPQIEKFLESPEERRLRRIRTGSLLSFIGLGAAIAFSIVSTIVDDDLLVIAGGGIVTLFIGLSFVVNGLLFTVPKKSVPDKSFEAESQRELDQLSAETNELILPESSHSFTSVIEDTTQHLKEKDAILRK